MPCCKIFIYLAGVLIPALSYAFKVLGGFFLLNINNLVIPFASHLVGLLVR